MFRDRTNLYLSYRRTYPHHTSISTGTSKFESLEEEENLIGGSDQKSSITFRDDTVYQDNIEMVTLPPSFLDISEQIDENIEQINKHIDKLRGLYKKNLLPGFNDRTVDEEEIEKLNYSTTNLFLKCNNMIKKLEGTKDLRDSRLKKDDKIMIDNMKKNYALQIQQLSSNFRKLQNNYIKFLKKDDFIPLSNNSSLKASDDFSKFNPAVDDEDTEALESYSKEAIKESSTILQQKSSINDSLIRQREQEITKLAQGVLEVSSIFKEMQNMIIDQGTILDRIDYNLENTKVDLQNATQELHKAQTYQKRTQKCKIILLLSLIVLGLLIVVLLKPHNSTKIVYKSTPDKPNANDQTVKDDPVKITIDDPENTP